MSLLNVTIPLTPQYVNASKSVVMYATNIDLAIPLTEGPHRLTTEVKVVGNLKNFKDPALMGCVTLWYQYDSQRKTVTFCSNDLVSNDSMYVTTFPRGSSQYCHQHTYNGDDNPCGTNPNWTYCTPLSPGLQTALQETVRNANSLIIEKAKAMGLTVIVRTPPPVLPAEIYEKLSAVYHRGKFLEFYDPGKEYDNDHTIYTLGSLWWGEVYLNPGDYFANVIGSTGDPMHNMSTSWIQLWASQFGQPTTCASFNFSSAAPPTGFPCNTAYLYGGHVIPGQVAHNVAAGGMIWIMPICVTHNNDDHVYMAPIMYNRGCVLSNFMQLPSPDETDGWPAAGGGERPL